MSRRAQRHHLVSRGYMRSWCDGGERLALIDKASRSVRIVGTRDAFVRPNVLTFATPDGPSDALEVAFGHIESEALPHLRRFASGERDHDSELATRVMLALHWARSVTLIDLTRRIFDEVTVELVNGSGDDQDYRHAFHRSFGRPPANGQLEALIFEHSERWRKSNNFFADKVQHYYNEGLQYLCSLNLERYELRKHGPVEFVLADAPVVVLGGHGRLQGSATRPIALEDADTIWFPVSPSAGVCVTKAPPTDLLIRPLDAQTLNLLSWRHANARLAGRLGSDLDSALGLRPGSLHYAPSGVLTGR